MSANLSELLWHIGRLLSAPLFPFRALEGFRLPTWAKTALGNLAIVFLALLFKTSAPVVGLVIVGLFVALQSLAILAGLVWLVAYVTLLASRRLGKTTEQVPPTARQDIVKAVGGPLDIFSFLLFWIWGLFYLAGCRVHVVNRVALGVWAVYVVAGCAVAVVSGIGHWVRARRTPPSTV